MELGYSCIDRLDEIEFFELSSPIILYTQNAEFFYLDFKKKEDFNKDTIKFAFKKELVIINTPFCFVAKKDKNCDIQIFYTKQISKLKHICSIEDIKDFILHSNEYYLGYEKRYKKIYENGVSTWESRLANESLVAIYKNFESYFKNKKVIDLGCGEGRDSIFLKKNDVDVTSIDISTSALEKARSFAKEQNLDIDFIESNVLFLNAFENESFDTAINMGCLHMIVNAEERKQHIKNVYRILKQGGIFIIDHCQRNWRKGFFSLPPHLYNKEKMIVGSEIKRRVRTNTGEKLMNLEVLPYMEKEKEKLIEEFSSFGFSKIYTLDTETQAFGDSVLLVFKKD
ncbi:methyltransferase domain-containing protein [Campylobacter sp. MIT 21-1685]|uniref:class I SAM-dependent methyltransferase n=1 Tax=unclassified Campylobacter TaxID=2593542 RepID=UPI00224B08A6|nr:MULTISPECIES: class I SAM-dependent methyltransferase [unclassified Campylobacter]MCX2682782.1 methyltransferase domain-containing protein [Campylobacter sp. MIT 21-1684]MCX2751072.1 methyltransferase domain-containing protein [Campylobacter sp. MIT 21-1682]MCX2807263.1 methyltransferase domain-containing protein [Campylobacter sp. MIT 21-1685]